MSLGLFQERKKKELQIMTTFHWEKNRYRVDLKIDGGAPYSFRYQYHIIIKTATGFTIAHLTTYIRYNIRTSVELVWPPKPYYSTESNGKYLK